MRNTLVSLVFDKLLRLMALPSGTKRGSYEILIAIGAGGMREVDKATDTRLGRLVAIKILPSQFSDQDWAAALKPVGIK